MAHARLTPVRVLTLRAKDDERVTFFDSAKGSPPGFALRVSPTNRSYALKFYVKKTGARGWLTLGEVGAISLDDARDRAKKAVELAKDGKDPRFVAAVDKERTVSAVVRDYIAAVKANRSPTTIEGYERLALHVDRAPELKAPVQAIEDGHVSAMLARIGASAGRYAANRVFNLMSAALRWARGMRKSSKKVSPPRADQKVARNPIAEMVSPFEEKKRERSLTDDEVVRLWRSLDKLTPTTAAAYVRFLILCGLRRNETSFVTWGDLNLGERMLTVPGKYRKGGRSHVVFLTPLALDVLRSIEPGEPNEPIFGDSGTAFRVNGSRMMRRVKKTTETRKGRKVLVPAIEFRLHDLRRTCATGCAKTGADLATVSRVLGHRTVSGALPVTADYVSHSYAKETRAALERWSRYVEELLGIERPVVVDISTREAVSR